MVKATCFCYQFETQAFSSGSVASHPDHPGHECIINQETISLAPRVVNSKRHHHNQVSVTRCQTNNQLSAHSFSLFSQLQQGELAGGTNWL